LPPRNTFAEESSRPRSMIHAFQNPDIAGRLRHGQHSEQPLSGNRPSRLHMWITVGRRLLAGYAVKFSFPPHKIEWERKSACRRNSSFLRRQNQNKSRRSSHPCFIVLGCTTSRIPTESCWNS